MQIRKMQMRHHLVALMLLCLSGITHAAEDKKPVGTIISFSAEASQTVSNDLARATVFAEANDANSAAVARKVNGLIAQAMATAKGFPEVKTRSGSTWTSPVYGKSGRNIEAWQMRSELQLESRDIAALGDLIGKLQGNLGVSQINLQPAMETRLKAQEQATLGALNAFQTKAKSIASNFKKYYKIVRMNVEGGNQGPIYPMVRSAMVKMEAAPMPIEGGDSTITVTVSGEIELIE